MLNDSKVNKILQLEKESLHLIETIINDYHDKNLKIGCLWSMGKDSTVLLHLIEKCFNNMQNKKLKFNEHITVIHINTKRKHPEMIKYRNKMFLEKYKNNNISVNRDYVNVEDSIISNDRKTCCNLLKTIPLRNLTDINNPNRFHVIFVGLRGDEESSRSKERLISRRNHIGDWDIIPTHLEVPGKCYDTSFNKNIEHVRIHPLLHWTEEDVWSYIKYYNIDVIDLYFSKNGERYRTIGCECCTKKIKSNAKNVDDILLEFQNELKGFRERSTREQDDEYGLEDLRKSGYM